MEKFLKKLAGVATEEFVLFTLFSSFVLLLNSFISVFNSVRLYFCFPAKECSSESLSCNIMNHRFSAYAPVSNSETTSMRSPKETFVRWRLLFLSFFFLPKVAQRFFKTKYRMMNNVYTPRVPEYLTICNQYSCTCRSLRIKVSIEISCLTISPLTECKIF